MFERDRVEKTQKMSFSVFGKQVEIAPRAMAALTRTGLIDRYILDDDVLRALLKLSPAIVNILSSVIPFDRLKGFDQILARVPRRSRTRRVKQRSNPAFWSLTATSRLRLTAICMKY